MTTSQPRKTRLERELWSSRERYLGRPLPPWSPALRPPRYAQCGERRIDAMASGPISPARGRRDGESVQHGAVPLLGRRNGVGQIVLSGCQFVARRVKGGLVGL